MAMTTRVCAFPTCGVGFEIDANSRGKYCLDHKGGRAAALEDPETEEERSALAAERKAATRLKQEVTDLRKQVKELEREEETADKIREVVYNLAAYTPNLPEWLYEKTPSGVPGVPMLLCSDWHWGEVVKKTEVGGVNEFNNAISNDRARRLFATTIDLAKNHMVNPSYPGIVVCLGGDMITGDIHEELQDTNDQYPLEAVHELIDVIGGGLKLLADHFGRVFVPCVVGNHGRTGKFSRFKGRVQTSYEWHLYCMLERLFRDDPRIVFMVPSETDAYFKVYNHRFLLTHGDTLGVKGGDGIIGAIGPIMRGAIKVGRSESQIGRDFDTILMGHWHQYLTLPGIIVNGTLKGYDEFARLALRAPYQRPSQALWFVHEKHGITAQWPIYLERKASYNDAAEWISWSQPVDAVGG